MHSFFTTMPSKNAVTMPLALVRFSFKHNETIQFTNLLTNSIHYEKESFFFDDDALACRYRLCESGRIDRK